MKYALLFSGLYAATVVLAAPIANSGTEVNSALPTPTGNGKTKTEPFLLMPTSVACPKSSKYGCSPKEVHTCPRGYSMNAQWMCQHKPKDQRTKTLQYQILDALDELRDDGLHTERENAERFDALLNQYQIDEESRHFQRDYMIRLQPERADEIRAEFADKDEELTEELWRKGYPNGYKPPPSGDELAFMYLAKAKKDKKTKEAQDAKQAKEAWEGKEPQNTEWHSGPKRRSLSPPTHHNSEVWPEDLNWSVIKLNGRPVNPELLLHHGNVYAEDIDWTKQNADGSPNPPEFMLHDSIVYAEDIDWTKQNADGSPIPPEDLLHGGSVYTNDIDWTKQNADGSPIPPENLLHSSLPFLDIYMDFMKKTQAKLDKAKGKPTEE